MKKYLQVVLTSGEGLEYVWEDVDFKLNTVGTELFFTVGELKSNELLLCVPITNLYYYRRVVEMEDCIQECRNDE